MVFVMAIVAILLFIFLWEITGLGYNKLCFGWYSGLICCFVILLMISAGVPSIVYAFIFGG